MKSTVDAEDGMGGEGVKATGRAFHLTPAAVWYGQEQGDCYVPEAYAEEEFIHCTREESLLLEVGNRYYRDDHRPYLLLEIDLGRVRAAAVYEDADHRYPHVFGPIETTAVTGVRGVLRDDDGTFVALGDRAGT